MCFFLRTSVFQRTSEFVDHPILSDVKILNLSFESIPTEVNDFIHNLGKKITAFSAVMTSTGIPKHQHITDGDIYFGGSGNIAVDVWNINGELTTTTLGNDFVITSPGEFHAVSISPVKNEIVKNEGELFFSVKFA